MIVPYGIASLNHGYVYNESLGMYKEGQMIKKIMESRFCFFVAAAIILYMATILLGQRPFLWDVADYWKRGEKLFENGGISLNIGSYRGYIFPFYLGCCSSLGGGT